MDSGHGHKRECNVDCNCSHISLFWLPAAAQPSTFTPFVRIPPSRGARTMAQTNQSTEREPPEPSSKAHQAEEHSKREREQGTIADNDAAAQSTCISGEDQATGASTAALPGHSSDSGEPDPCHATLGNNCEPPHVPSTDYPIPPNYAADIDTAAGTIPPDTNCPDDAGVENTYTTYRPEDGSTGYCRKCNSALATTADAATQTDDDWEHTTRDSGIPHTIRIANAIEERRRLHQASLDRKFQAQDGELRVICMMRPADGETRSGVSASESILAHGLASRIKAQLHRDPPTLRELQDIAEVVELKETEIIGSEHARLNDRNYHSDQLAATLQSWGKAQDLPLQLGYLQLLGGDQKEYQILRADGKLAQPQTVWIHWENTHWDGLARKLPNDTIPDIDAVSDGDTIAYSEAIDSDEEKAWWESKELGPSTADGVALDDGVPGCDGDYGSDSDYDSEYDSGSKYDPEDSHESDFILTSDVLDSAWEYMAEDAMEGEMAVDAEAQPVPSAPATDIANIWDEAFGAIDIHERTVQTLLFYAGIQETQLNNIRLDVIRKIVNAKTKAFLVQDHWVHDGTLYLTVAPDSAFPPCRQQNLLSQAIAAPQQVRVENHKRNQISIPHDQEWKRRQCLALLLRYHIGLNPAVLLAVIDWLQQHQGSWAMLPEPDDKALQPPLSPR
ncbi:hypothetical protein C8A03DRAFT_37891 [Achaetomium macrosporum]|uniref:Uncharacterized protein n=1 Tax=Achaetomium macrosporum TaxID=79813 RepID=A0AAN7HAQ9_9PEZI|nr:hypothetical protein C8A03DRAFT_37891 [Achaetomium macrosporum]